jgi:hypothetical protein
VVPDGIPMKFFNILVPDKDDSEESDEHNKIIFNIDLNCLKALINRTWFGDFSESVNNPLIVSIT